MAAPNRSAFVLGWMPGSTGTPTTSSVNAAANWVAFGFVADSARTLSAVRVYVSAIGGTLGANDITCDLYDSTGSTGSPGSSIETGNVPTATITGAGWYNFTGFTTALTAGQMYYFVFKNVNGTPATNFATFRTITNSLLWMQGTSATRFCWARCTSTNSGSSWSLGGPAGGWRVDYTDGYDGIAVSNGAIAAVGDGVYSTRESGVVFTTPKNSLIRAAGLSIFIGGKTGTITGTPRLRLWENRGGTPVAVGTATLPTASAALTTQWLYGYFDSSAIVTMRPNTTYRLTVGETTQSDTSSNRINNYEFTWDTDSNSTPLLPWNGTCQKTYFDGSSWTDTAGSIFAHAVLLDMGGEYRGNADAYHQLGI